ncbi:RNA-directed DNA polymerase, eukaryota, reverse transcriptase zinc-binding domain protein [Tanacetum coccineum]
MDAPIRSPTGIRAGLGEHLAPMERPNKIPIGDRGGFGAWFANRVWGWRVVAPLQTRPIAIPNVAPKKEKAPPPSSKPTKSSGGKQKKKLREEKDMKPETFASLVSTVLYEKRFGPYFCQHVIAGLGDDDKPFICTMDSIGANLLVLPTGSGEPISWEGGRVSSWGVCDGNGKDVSSSRPKLILQSVLSNKECLDEGVKGVERIVTGSENKSSVSNDESELNVAHGEKENKDDSDKMQVDHKQAYVEDRNENENKMRNKNNVKSYANATRDNMPQEINKLRNIPISLNELGEEVITFDEELVKLGSKKWELTLCGQCVGHNMSMPMLNYHLRRMWSRCGFKEIIYNGNGRWLFKFNKEDEMLEVATKIWVKLFNMSMEAWTNDGVSTIASCIEEISKENAEAEKRKKDLEFQAVHNRNKRPIRNMDVNKKGFNQNGNKFSVLNGISDDDPQELIMLKDKMLVDKYLNLKLQPGLDEMKKWTGEMRNYFKRAWEVDREKERNEMLDDMEGIVEDVLEDESIAIKNITANVTNGKCSSILN